MNVRDKKLFMKYAVPCADTLLQRGQITRERLDDLIKKATSGKGVSDEDIDLFKVAKAHCTVIAKHHGKGEIDMAVMEEYYLGKHDDAVDERFEQMGDFDAEKCRIYGGRVLSADEGSALVETITGKARYRTDFTPKIKGGDCVVVHRDFIVKKISESLLGKLQAGKENYFKSRKQI